MKIKILIILTLLSQIVYSQIKIQESKQFKGYIIREVGAVIVNENDKLVCKVIQPKDSRLKEYQDIDIQKDDVIFYFNGKKLKTIDDLKKNYEALAIDTEIQLGLKRNSESHILNFKKANPEKIPNMKIITKEKDGSTSVSEQFNIIKKNGKNYMNGKEISDEKLKKFQSGKTIMRIKNEKKDEK